MTSPFDALYLEPAEKKTPHVVHVGLVDHSGRYKIGPPTHPTIVHDNGFLDKFKKREPTVADQIQLQKWIATLKGSELLCNGSTRSIVPACHDEDLTDANAAYRHFLFGTGTDRAIDYERFLKNDASGRALLPKIISDFEKHVTIIGKDRTMFSVTSDSYTVGDNGIAEYPATVNWQRTLGAHTLWVSANVSVSSSGGKIIYDADIVVHMEDRYNFNPGAHDIATGIPDQDNGRFEITGLAHQYMNYGTVTRHIRWLD